MKATIPIPATGEQDIREFTSDNFDMENIDAFWIERIYVDTPEYSTSIAPAHPWRSLTRPTEEVPSYNYEGGMLISFGENHTGRIVLTIHIGLDYKVNIKGTLETSIGQPVSFEQLRGCEIRVSFQPRTKYRSQNDYTT